MYRVSEAVRSTHNQDGAIVLDVRQGQMFNLNVVGSRILELLKGGSLESLIVDEVSREFGVRRDVAEKDVHEFLQNLKKCRLVEEQESGVAVSSETKIMESTRLSDSGDPLRDRDRTRKNYSRGATGGVNELRTMSFLILKAYLNLIRFDLYLARGNFAAIYDKVTNYPVGNPTFGSDGVERICSAVDMACIWYWKEARCLQRSAATTCLLKSHGIFAQMVIGAQQMPFKAHAWVEVDGRVVNDKSYVSQTYAVMNRC
jgi:hypothetical protein